MLALSSTRICNKKYKMKEMKSEMGGMKKFLKFFEIKF